MKIKIEKAFLALILCLLPIFLFRGLLLPQIKDRALQAVKKEIEKNLRTEVFSQDIRISLWKGGIIFKKSYIKEKKGEQKTNFTIESIFVEDIGVDFSLLAFLYGKVKIRNIKINTPQIHLIWNDNSSDPMALSPGLTGLNLRPLFKMSKDIGIKKISIQNANIHISRGENRKTIPYFEKLKVKNVSLTLEKIKKKFSFTVDLPSLSAYFDEKESSFMSHLKIHLNSIFSEKEMEIRSFHVSELNKEDYFINISGIFFDVDTILETKNMSFSSNINWGAEYLSRLNRILFNVKKFPLRGMINLNTTARIKGKKHNISFKIDTKNLHLSNYLLGDAHLLGKIENKKLQLKKSQLNHSSGILEFKEGYLLLGKKLKLNMAFNMKQLKIESLLDSLKIQAPLNIETEGDIHCRGDLYPSLSVTCTSQQIEANPLKVFSGKNQKIPIIESKPIRISGKTTITSREVRYEAFLDSDYGSAKSTGNINYEEGFLIDISSPHFEFKQFLQRITNLKIEGSFEITGHIRGTSKYAIMSMKSKSDNLWIEDYFLGNSEFDFKYKKGVLSFNNVKANAFSTRYSGDLTIDVYKSLIKGKMQSPHLEFSDLHKIFIRKINFPKEILGTGQAYMNWSGPLGLNKIQGDMFIKSKKIQFLDEFFNDASFEVYFEEGTAYSKDIHLFKNKSVIQAFGWINLQNKVEFKVKGDNIDLYEFSMINKSFLSVTGKIDLNVEISGTTYNPNILVESHLRNIKTSESHLGNSTIYISKTNQFLRLKAHMFDNQVYLNTQIPYKNNQKLYFTFNALNWNFGTLFPLFHKEIHPNEYISQITSKIEFTSNSGKIQNMGGTAYLKSFLLKKEDMLLQNIEPITVSVKNGNIKDTAFHFRGNQDSFLKIESQNSSISDLNLKLQLKSDLNLFLFLFPFLEDIGGSFFVAINIKKDLLFPEFDGNINFENIFFKMYNIKHLVENLNFNAEIKNKTVVMTSLSGLFSESPLQGKGKIEFNKIGDVPLDMNLQLNISLLEMPEDIVTSGLLEMHLYGKWFPYNLDGTYNISDGTISKEFEQDKSKYQSYFIDQKNPYSLNINMGIVSKKGIKIQNSRFDGKIKGSFLVSGNIESPFLMNSVEIEPKSKILFRDHFFVIDSGYIRFDDKEKNNPNIFINGSAEIRKYQINFTAKERADNPTVLFTSTPSLSEKDIISLIVTNKTLQELETDNVQKSEQILLNSSYQIGASFITKKLLKDQINKDLGVNIKVDSDLNEDTNVSEPRLTLSRGITKDLNIQASRSLGGNNEVKMEYQMNNNMSAIGGWKGRESRNINSKESNQQSVLSLDLQYQINFK